MSFGNSRDTSLNSKLTNCAGLEEICLSFAGERVCLSISLSSPEEKIDLITAFNRRNGTVNKTKNNSLIIEGDFFLAATFFFLPTSSFCVSSFIGSCVGGKSSSKTGFTKSGSTSKQ
ncbi:MAG: hypothetical protein KKC11_05090 [Candidatus Omnitrophica bacterium]|nr:hypothetical protein [Candidatus Omnitrophota bacterium]MBU1809731.1 hypothetical protein [Candidatus Omnitrophota bacterium]